jgi:hypothetical protein
MSHKGDGTVQSVLLLAEQPKDWGSIPGRCKRVFSIATRLALGLTQPRIQWLSGFLPSEAKRQGHLHLVPRLRMMELYLHSPIRLHGIMLD